MTAQDHVPDFFNPDHAGDWHHRPNVPALRAEAERWRRHRNIAPATAESRLVELLLVDCQKDFCLPEGALFVGGRSGRGAVEDTTRIAEFIYRNVAELTRITTTFDSHFTLQIFFDSFWVGPDGERPAPFSTVTAAEVRDGRWQVDPAAAQFAYAGSGENAFEWARRQALHYVETLESTGKYALVIWPYHCLVGGDGHALVGAIQEARLFHSTVRQIQSIVELKGSHPWTEHYSVFAAEVTTRWDGGALVSTESPLLQRLARNDMIIVAGQAASHCVMWSVDDLLAVLSKADPSLVRRVYILTDCMSSVVARAPDGTVVADFTPETEAAHARWSGLGACLVRSTTPMSEWPS